MIDYYHKYKKYKHKYINLNLKGGDTENESRIDWIKRLKNTNSFIKLKDIKENKIYIIQDNGGDPFKVIVDNNSIKVYSNTEEENKKLLEYKAEDIDGYWPGLDTENEEYDGNAILIKLSNTKYVHVTISIYEFQTEDKIIDYISDIGNSSVAWPMAFGEKYVYFLNAFNEYMDKNDLKNVSLSNTINLYDQFIDENNTNTKSKIKGVKTLVERTDDNWLGFYNSVVNSLKNQK